MFGAHLLFCIRVAAIFLILIAGVSSRGRSFSFTEHGALAAAGERGEAAAQWLVVAPINLTLFISLLVSVVALPW